VEIAVETDPLEALMENSTTRTRLPKTEFWNDLDRKSPYLIVVLISCINVAIDTKEYLVAIMFIQLQRSRKIMQ
jgi:hypothetical protein